MAYEPAGDPAAPLVTLGLSQLEIKAASANNYDMQGLGLLAFNGALLAANIAAENLLEKLWYLSVFGLAASVVMCVRVLATGAVDVGEKLATAREEWGGATEPEINALVVDSLAEALAQADERLLEKQVSIGWAEWALVAASVLAAISAIVS
jgi:hypothetical protein